MHQFTRPEYQISAKSGIACLDLLMIQQTFAHLNTVIFSETYGPNYNKNLGGD